MKSINKLFFLCVLFSLSFSQFDWEDNGIAIRQGYHIEWQRTADIGDDGSVILTGYNYFLFFTLIMLIATILFIPFAKKYTNEKILLQG